MKEKQEHSDVRRKVVQETENQSQRDDRGFDPEGEKAKGAKVQGGTAWSNFKAERRARGKEMWDALEREWKERGRGVPDTETLEEDQQRYWESNKAFVDPADVDEKKVTEVPDDTDRRAEWAEQGRKKGDHPPMKPGDVISHPKSGKEAVLQHSHRDADDETDNGLFRYTDGSGGFTAASNFTNAEKKREWLPIDAPDWDKAVANHKVIVEDFGGQVYDGTSHEATRPEAAKEPTSAKKKAAEAAAKKVEDAKTEAATDDPTPEAKQFGGSANAANHLKEQLGEAEFNKRVEAGDLDGVRNIGQARRHIIDNPPSDAGPTEPATEPAAEKAPPPSDEGAEQGRMDMGEEEESEEKESEDADGAGDGEDDGTSDGDDDGTSDGEDEVPPEDAKKKRMMDKAREEGLFEHIAEDKPFTYENAAEAEEAMAKLSTDKLGPLLDKTTKAKKAAADKAEAVLDNDKKAAAATKAKERSDAAKNVDTINNLTEEMPDGTTRADATDKYREILEHKERYGDDIDKAGKNALADAADNLVKNHNADFQRAHNLVQQHADAGGFGEDATTEHQETHDENISQQRGEIETEDSFHEHVSGESGSAARKNAFDNNDSGRVVHTDDKGKVTHSTLMDSRFDDGRKKVEESGKGGASAHHSDHDEVHGGDATVKGSRPSQSHHDWDTSKRGQHSEVGQQQIAAYKDAATKMDAAQKAGNPEEEETQKQAMAKLDEESGGALSTMMSDTEKEQERIDRGQPPGPPPRAGLVWAAGIHHWVSPEKLSEIQGGLGDGEGMHITPGDFQSMLGHGDSDPTGQHADGSQGHQGAVHVTKFGVHRVTDTPDPNEGTPSNLSQPSR